MTRDVDDDIVMLDVIIIVISYCSDTGGDARDDVSVTCL